MSESTAATLRNGNKGHLKPGDDVPADTEAKCVAVPLKPYGMANPITAPVGPHGRPISRSCLTPSKDLMDVDNVLADGAQVFNEVFGFVVAPEQSQQEVWIGS